MDEIAHLISSIRQERFKTGKVIKGRKGLSADLTDAITEETSQLSLTEHFNIRNLNHALHKTVQIFAELARRLQMPIPQTLIPDVTRHLLLELSANCLAFSEYKRPEALISLTICHGTNFTSAMTQAMFESLRDTPFIFKYAAIHNPLKPREFLTDILAKIDKLSKDPDLESLRDMPGVFKYAAVFHPTNPKQALLDHISGKSPLKTNAYHSSFGKVIDISAPLPIPT